MGMIFGITGMWISGFLLGRFYERRKAVVVANRIDSKSWNKLTSGWSRNVGHMTAYAMQSEGEAYWWVSRNGKTVIEGPARSLEAAKLEAENEARALISP